ncbi:unnamed protein product [Ilex paraguariensis]|uniref:UBL3-like ubiquitin domain-containing protein n=1 Tax=Ilex paraguariensis TaxID=185542 RepID=A0ABC8URP7_9AQUA
MPEEDLVELKFRLYDGSDIGPFRYSPAATVAMLKERIVAEWPKAPPCSSLDYCNPLVIKEFIMQITSYHSLKFLSSFSHSSDGGPFTFENVAPGQGLRVKVECSEGCREEDFSGGKAKCRINLCFYRAGEWAEALSHFQVKVECSGGCREEGSLSYKKIVPKAANDVKLISAGKILENNKTVGQCKTPFGDLPKGIITMHAVVQPSLAKAKTEKKVDESPKKSICACSIL